MTSYEDCIALITVVADALGPYRSEFVFVGGAVVGLLITTSGLRDVRPTDDVDLIVETATYAKYTDLITELRKLGFAHVIDGPICRFTIHGVTVDVMPTEEDILGFRNKWYPLVVKTATEHVLPNHSSIRLINAPMFICTKLEAFNDRGKHDFISSHDMEDIVAIINGRDELICESWGMPSEVRHYLKNSFKILQSDENFLEALPGILPHGAANREHIVQFKMSQLARIPEVASFTGQIMVRYSTTPLEIAVVSMKGTNQQLSTRKFDLREEFLNCLADLNIHAEIEKIRTDSYNPVYSVKNISLEVLAKWRLVNPLD